MKTFLLMGLIYLPLAFLSSKCNGISEKFTDSLYMDYDHRKVPYKFYQPDANFSLGKDLEEISGLSVYQKDQLVAVEDENGIIYCIDADDGRIQNTIKFSGKGDYEAVEVVESTVYVLQSNGKLLSFDINDKEGKTVKIQTDLSQKNDVEGLGYNGGHLLLACKGKGGLGDSNVAGKSVYFYDLHYNRLSDAVFNFNKRDLNYHLRNKQFYTHLDDFDPSAIAVHPALGDWYVLSADKVLAVFSSDHRVKEVIKLDPALYRQPEGICFTAEGILFISSEKGRGATGRIIKLLPLK